VRGCVTITSIKTRDTRWTMKKVVGWIVLALVIFYIGTNPGPAADIAEGIGEGIAEVFRNIGVFFSELAN
jgi:hypothetical protein